MASRGRLRPYDGCAAKLPEAGPESRRSERRGCPSPQRMARRPLFPVAFFAALPALLALAAPASSAFAGDPPPAAPPTLTETARKEALEGLGKDLRRMCASPRAEEKREEINKTLDAVEALGGVDGADTSLDAIVWEDEA